MEDPRIELFRPTGSDDMQKVINIGWAIGLMFGILG